MVDRLADYGEAKALADRLRKVSQKNPGMTLTSENIELIRRDLEQERILADC
jgi:hypothetical protein